MFKCKCGKQHSRFPSSNVKHGTRYVIMFDCDRCKRTIGVEGTKGVKPPKVMV